VWIPIGKYVIVYITYLLLGWTFDIMDISLNSLLPVMTAEPKERNSLSLVKMIGYISGGMAISILGPIIVADGMLNSYYKLIFGAMIVVLVGSIGGALGVKERVAFKGDSTEKYGFKDMFSFLGTKPILITFVAALLYGVGTQLQNGANAYFFTYVMGDLSLLAGVSGMSIIGMLPAIILSPIIANKIGKKKVYALGLIIAVIGFAIRFINLTSMPILYVSAILVAFGGGFTATLMYGIQADNTTYVQYKTGKRAEAAIASLSSFISKVGQGIAGALPGYVLAATGFIANAAHQNKAVSNGIIACVLVIPMALCLIALFVFAFGYTLTKKDVDDMAVAIELQSNQKVI
ncbi:MAG: MFS transporter, partial [Clostridia bacterium]